MPNELFATYYKMITNKIRPSIQNEKIRNMFKNTICKKRKNMIYNCEYDKSTQVYNMPFHRGYLVKLHSELIIWLRPASRPVEETISILRA